MHAVNSFLNRTSHIPYLKISFNSCSITVNLALFPAYSRSLLFHHYVFSISSLSSLFASVLSSTLPALNLDLPPLVQARSHSLPFPSLSLPDIVAQWVDHSNVS
eukprot:134354_1